MSGASFILVVVRFFVWTHHSWKIFQCYHCVFGANSVNVVKWQLVSVYSVLKYLGSQIDISDKSKNKAFIYEQSEE